MAFDSFKARRAARQAAVAGTRTVGDVIGLIFKILGTVLLLCITTGAMFAIIFALYVRTTLEPQIDITLEEYSINLTSSIYLENQETGEWEKWVDIDSGEERIWIEYDQMPENIINAAVAIEDKRFYEHKGVDWYRTAGVSYSMFFGSDDSAQGGSTITQQLIKNLTNEDDVTVKRKVLEIFRALEVEKLYEKEEIMEWYLNVIGLGGRINGVGAAAQYYYGKDVWDLSLAQCASIVGITQYPTKYNPYLYPEYNKEKRDLVLDAMYEQGYISYEEKVSAQAEPIVLDRVDGATWEAPDYTYYQELVIQDAIKEYQEELGLSDKVAQDRVYYGGLKIYAAQDARVQAELDDVYKDWEQMPVSGLQSAMVIMDQTNGYIVGMAGGVGEKVGNFVFNRATDAKRPPGSAIKPIAVYGPALEYGVITPSSTYEDNPTETVGGSKWPNNDNRVWSGNNYNIVAAVQRSVNTVAVQVLNDLTIERSYSFMTNELEIELDAADAALAPLALGQLTYGLTVREITAAYCALANDGIYSQSVTYQRIVNAEDEVVFDHTVPTQKTVFKSEVAGQMTAILLNAVNNGTGTAARLSNYDVAGKTGTTGDSKDRWFCGYTPYYTAACWTGYDIPQVINASGNPACQIWQTVMTRVHEATGKPPAGFEDLPSLTSETEAVDKVEICLDSKMLATDACRNYVGGSRVQTLGANEDEPTQSCTLHESVSLCSVTGQTPNETCTVVSRGILVSERNSLGICGVTHEHEGDPDPTDNPEPTEPEPTDPPNTVEPDPTDNPEPTEPEPTVPVPDYDPVPMSYGYSEAGLGSRRRTVRTA